jgi:Uma2 family endonuclease
MSSTTASTFLTLEDYQKQYGSQHGWEYDNGEAVRKPVPDWLHGALQALLVELLYRAGYYSSSEVDLHIIATWSPRPDAAGNLKRIDKYPTEPIDIVMEVLSDDQMDDLLKKCSRYSALGIRQIFVLSGEHHKIWVWKSETLYPIDDIALGNGKVILGATIWSELEKRLNPSA